MKRTSPWLALLLVSLAAAGTGQVSASGQAATQMGRVPGSRPIALELRPAGKISPEDAQVIDAHAPQIALAAAIYGYSLDASWSYEQAVCPLAPGHILLNYYSREGGESRFSAVVPRQGKVVRIVPLVRAGTAPFVSPWGAHSYAVFNAITAAEPGLRQQSLDPGSGAVFDWGLCYVALVSDPPEAVSDPDGQLHLVSGVQPTLKLLGDGGVGIALTVQEDARQVSIWNLDFSRTGSLVHVDREQRELDPDDTVIAQDGNSAPALPITEGGSSSSGQTPLSGSSAATVHASAAPPTGMAPAVAEPAPAPNPAVASAAPNPAPDPPAEQPASPVEATRLEGRPVPDGPAPPSRAVPDGPAPIWRPVPQN